MKRTILTAGMAFLMLLTISLQANAADPNEKNSNKEKPSAEKNEWVLSESASLPIHIRPDCLFIAPTGDYAVCQGSQTTAGPPGMPAVEDNFLWLVNLNTGTKKDLLEDVAVGDDVKAVFAEQLSFSPDGKKLLLSLSLLRQKPGTEHDIDLQSITRLLDLKTGTDKIFGDGEHEMATMGSTRIFVSRMAEDQVGPIETYSLDGEKKAPLALCGLVLGASPDGKRLIALTNPSAPTTPIKKEERESLGVAVVRPDGTVIRQLGRLTEILSKPVVSPQTNYVAYLTGDRQSDYVKPMGVKVCRTSDDKTFTVEGTMRPIAVTDSGNVITMADQNGPGTSDLYAVKCWDAEGQSQLLTDDALAACVSGQRLYYLTNEDGKIVLKYIPLKTKKMPKGEK